MSGGVDDWSPEQRLRVELRKAKRAAGKAGEPETFAVLAEGEALADVPFLAGESLSARVRSRTGQRLYFGSTSARLKREHGDRLILHSADGRRWQLDHLGRAFQALHNFFQWAVRDARDARPGAGEAARDATRPGASSL